MCSQFQVPDWRSSPWILADADVHCRALLMHPPWLQRGWPRPQVRTCHVAASGKRSSPSLRENVLLPIKNCYLCLALHPGLEDRFKTQKGITKLKAQNRNTKKVTEKCKRLMQSASRGQNIEFCWGKEDLEIGLKFKEYWRVETARKETQEETREGKKKAKKLRQNLNRVTSKNSVVTEGLEL